MAKHIKFDIEARDGLKRGVDALANAVKVTLGPIKTSSSIVTPSHSCTPGLIVTRSPTTTSFSKNV